MADTSTIARPYAKAVFDLARAERKLAAWSEALAAAAAVVADAGAKRALANPALDDAARATLVGSIAGGIKGGELSVLYPMVSLGYIWTLLWSKLFFNEPFTRNKFLGLGLILLGVFFVGLGS